MLAQFLFFLALTQLNHAYVHTGNYVGFGEMRPDYAYILAEGEENSNRGAFWVTYNGGSNTLSYSVGSTYPEYTKVAIYGATSCAGVQLQSRDCVEERVSDELHVLSTEGMGMISGSVTLTCEQVDMLFSGELYIRLDLENKPEGALRAPITMFSAAGDDDLMVLPIVFEPNSGQYNSEDISSESTNSGFGYFTWTISTNRLDYRIYHSAEDVSSFILECPTLSANRVKTMNGNTENAVFTANTVFDDEPEMILEMLTGNCFFYMISRAFVNGELFGRVTPFGQNAAVLTGQEVVPSVTSSVYARAVFQYDLGRKLVYALVAHNVTEGDLTAINIKWGGYGENGETLCTSTTANFQCQLNTTSIMSLFDERLYIEVETATAGGAEIRGQMTQDVAGFSSGGLSSGAIIAIAIVGAIVGVALIGAVGFFVYKKSTGFGTSKI